MRFVRMLSVAVLAGASAAGLPSIVRAEPRQAEPSAPALVAPPPPEALLFYRRAAPGEAAALLERWAAATPDRQARRLMPAFGFVAALAEKYPTQIDAYFPASLSPSAQKIAVAGVAMGGPAGAAEALAARYGWGSGPSLAPVGLPRLWTVHVRNRAGVDLMWGAAFATGDPRYVRRILDYVISSVAAAAASDCRPDPYEIAALSWPGPSRFANPFIRLRDRYGAPCATRMLEPARALRSLAVAGRTHPFVRDVVGGYVRMQPDAPVARVLQFMLGQRPI